VGHVLHHLSTCAEQWGMKGSAILKWTQSSLAGTSASSFSASVALVEAPSPVLRIDATRIAEQPEGMT
jgi:hypothetical protein